MNFDFTQEGEFSHNELKPGYYHTSLRSCRVAFLMIKVVHAVLAYRGIPIDRTDILTLCLPVLPALITKPSSFSIWPIPRQGVASQKIPRFPTC
jgi:hypothetical protein